jgi:Rod binding domain-containing protein
MDMTAAAPKTTPPPAQGLQPLPPATPQQRARIEHTAKQFEGQLISMMLQPMFEGLSSSGPFGGGQAESTYRSFMVDAFGQQMAKAGGIGVAAPVMREMLKMQGLS